ncbi:hypothetical protein [Acidithiobacillus sp.]|jgi:hypothetical protein|uniref:hypothetical protein n=1 Tax=Acidithiobacillus sp. TaxID=1872118 RepID=UPI0025BDE0EC|nr:hypothetical protein [Acidithiobacillus sp.]MCK9188384.1 hypothetical protein [Acidithiobacillus sp.]MCK9358805.1 hypothetical protein [Acidithiobacillus sp.]
MFKDESSYSVNPAGELPAGWAAEAMVVANKAPVLARVEQYMARLSMTDAQRLWIRGQVVAQLCGTDMEGEALYGQAFASLHMALATLTDGDELDARLDLSLSLPVGETHDGKSCRWLQRQMAPATVRSSMASRPLNRSWGAALLRLVQSLLDRRAISANQRVLPGEA